MENLRNEIIDIIKENSSYPEVEGYLNENDDLTEIGLDSISFIKIIVALEQNYDIEFDDISLDFSNFDSFNKLCDFVKESIENS